MGVGRFGLGSKGRVGRLELGVSVGCRVGFRVVMGCKLELRSRVGRRRVG